MFNFIFKKGYLTIIKRPTRLSTIKPTAYYIDIIIIKHALLLLNEYGLNMPYIFTFYFYIQNCIIAYH